MGKRVVIIASGETERRALPYFVSHLQSEQIAVVEIRIPRGGRALNVEMAEKLIKASWYATVDDQKPDKFVILVDTDGKSPAEVLQPFQDQLPGRLGSKITAALQFACAQWHLEAWYFADAKGLREWRLGRDLGAVDTSRPDEIENPKQHLKHLLGDHLYTAQVSEEIARQLNAHRIKEHSPSFHGFLGAVRNGGSAAIPASRDEVPGDAEPVARSPDSDRAAP